MSMNDTKSDCKNMHLKKLIEEIYFDVHDDGDVFNEFLKIKKDELASLWAELEENFGIKLIIWIREILMSKIRYFPYIGDKHFLHIWVKVLSVKNFSETYDFIQSMSYLIGFLPYLPSVVEFTNAQDDVEVKRKIEQTFQSFFGKTLSAVQNKPILDLQIWYEVNIICAGTIAGLLIKLFKNPNIIIKWKIPDSWYYPVQSQHPFENYLQEKKVALIALLLKEGNAFINKEEIGWWTDESLKKQHLQFFMENTMEYSPNLLWAPKKRRLQKYNAIPVHPSEALTGYSTNVDFSNDDNKNALIVSNFNVLVSSFVPLMSTKFHIASSIHLNPHDTHCIQVLPWFLSWCENFNEEFYDLINYRLVFASSVKQLCIEENTQAGEIQLKNFEFKKEIGLNPMCNWYMTSTMLTQIVHEIRLVPAAPRQPYDNISRSSQFLLEPFILIQIPWNFVIFRQWMSAAMIEILKFEADTVEFRHWPIIDPGVEKCARELLFLVKQNKHRLLVALYYMSRQIALYPSTCSSLPENLMDIAIIPSIPFLQFLTSGTAYKLLNTLKQTAFSSSEEINNNKIMFLNKEIYEVHEDLEKMYTEHYFNFVFWSEFLFEQITPYDWIDDDLFKKEIDKPIPNKSKLYSNTSDLTLEEKVLYVRIFNFRPGDRKNTNLFAKQLMSAMSATIKCIIQYGYFPKSAEAIMEKLLLSKNYQTAANDLAKFQGDITPEIIKTDAEKILISAYLHNLIRTKLNKAVKNNSPDGWLYRLTGEVIERNCLARIVKLVSLTIRKTPTFPNLSTCPKENLESLSPIINDIFIRQNEIKRDWLWNQFPKEWNQKVRFDHTVPDILDENKSVLLVIKEAVKIFEERLGCLLLNIAKDSFVAFNDCRNKFSNWTCVQYAMPVFLSMLLGFMKTPIAFKNLRNRVFNFVTLINTMLSEYELQYKTWLTSDDNYRGEVTTKLIYDDDIVMKKIDVLKIINKCALSTIGAHQLIRTYVGVSDSGASAFKIDGLPSFSVFINSFETYQYVLNAAEWENISSSEVSQIRSILNVDLNFFQFLHKCCIKAWNPPQPGDEIADKDLNMIYIADTILFRLSYVLSEILGVDESSELFTPSSKLSNCLVCPFNSLLLIGWRISLMSAICTRRDNITTAALPNTEYNAEDVKDIIYKGREHLNNIWKQFCVLIRKIDVFPKRIESFYSDSPVITKAFELFCSGNLVDLQKHLQLKDPGHVKAKMNRQCNTIAFHRGNAFIGSQRKKGKHEPNSILNTRNARKKLQENQEVVIKHCRLCHAKEKRSGSFITCPSCVKDKYPDVHYYCSSRCKDRKWLKEHRVEHMEYSMGISSLNDAE